MYFIADSTNTVASTYDRAPLPCSLLDPLYRLLAPLPIAATPADVWLSTSRHRKAPDDLLRSIHHMARRGAQRAGQHPQHSVAPWLCLLVNRVRAF